MDHKTILIFLRIKLFISVAKQIKDKNKVAAAEAIWTYRCTVHSHACTSLDYYKKCKWSFFPEINPLWKLCIL